MKNFFVLVSSLALAATSQADLLTFTATMTGAQETPPNASTGLGNAVVQIDTVTLHVFGFVRWTGLTGGDPTGSHIHVGVPGTAGDVIYNYGVAGLVDDGIYKKKVFDMQMVDLTKANTGGTGFNGVLQTPAQQIQNWFLQNHTYVNVHNSTFPAGELRGQLQAVPEPTSMAALGLGALALLRRRKG
jgi:hypothetical protein